MDLKFLHRDYGITRHGGGAEFTGKRMDIPLDLQRDLGRYAGGTSYSHMTEVVDRRDFRDIHYFCLVPEMGGDYLIAGKPIDFAGCTTDRDKVRRVISMFYAESKGKPRRRQPRPALEARVRA